jgi:V/A-type H+-transporting ATPase subunit C
MGKDTDFLKGVLFTGGNIDPSAVLSAAGAGGSVAELYALTNFREAAEAGAAAISGGGLTRFEKLCDDAIMAYVRDAQHTAFGEATLVAYLVARESEATAIRIIMTGRLADLPVDVIRERLRESYV